MTGATASALLGAALLAPGRSAARRGARRLGRGRARATGRTTLDRPPAARGGTPQRRGDGTPRRRGRRGRQRRGRVAALPEDPRPSVRLRPDPAARRRRHRHAAALRDARAGGRRVVLDVGCGTGDALKYLDGFERYLGVDNDPVAIDAASARFAGRTGVRFVCRTLRAEDVVELAPTGVVLSGLLHHLADAYAEAVLRLAARSPRLARIVTSDIVFLPGKHFNNLLARLDRGRQCRVPDGYAAVAGRAGLVVEKRAIVASSPANDRIQYFLMSLVQARPIS